VPSSRPTALDFERYIFSCPARREFDAARRLLADVIAREPAALLPRVVLSYVLLQEGRDLPAAEQALCDVLALAPDHAETRRNLAFLRAQDRRRTPTGRKS
jgi:uncharacterized protein HemY